MKTRILSLFLALVTLLCALPFAAQAEEAVTPAAEETKTELADFYVKDGLVALFTAFDGSYISGSTWTDRVNGKKATLSSVSKKQWKLREGGGVGFDTFYGMIDQYGVFQTESAYNNASVNAVRVDFGLSLFPQEDMTIEYLAKYLPVYVADTSGNIALDEYKQPIETFDAMGNGPSDFASWRIDSIGWFGSFSTHIDGYQSGWASTAADRGTLFFIFDMPYWTGSKNGWWVGSGDAWTSYGGMSKTGDPFHQNGTIRTYEYSIDETLTVAGDGTRTVTALFSMRRDLVLYNDNSNNINSTANAQGGAWYKEDADSNQMFHLSADRPTDFYSIRIYERTLSDEDRLQNYAADVIHYYGLTGVTEETLPALKAVLKGGNFGFATDATEKAAVKAQILAALKDEAIIQALYAQEGLQALYTAFDDTYVDLAAGTWTDRIGGKTATLGNKQYWHVGEDGGVGSLMLWGQYVGGTFTESAVTNNADVYGTRLNFGIDQLPATDYTVEYVAEYKNIMATDASGNPVKPIVEIADATWPANTSSLNGGIAYGSVEQFGNLFGYSLKRDSYFTGSDEGGYYGGLGGLGYQYTIARRTNNWNIESTVPNNQGILRKTGVGNVFHERGAIHTLELSRDSENDTTNVLTQYKDLALWVSATTTNVSCADEHTGGNDYFYLGERVSVDYYAVRIYDRLLTDAERKSNRLADLIFYYDLNATDVASLKRLAGAMDFTKYPFETDASARAAMKTTLQQLIDREGTEVGLYAQDGLIALWTAFGSADSVNTSTGVWTDRITGRAATLTTASRWSKGALGGVGFSGLHGMIGADGVYTATSAYNNTKEGGPRLDLGTALLPEEDFTVEYLAMYQPIYVADANGNIATDAEGNPIETYVAAGSNGKTTSYVNSHHKWPVDALGWFSAFTTNLDGYESGWGNGGRGTIYFIFNNVYWSSGNLGNFVGPGGNYGASSGMNVAGNPFHQNGSIRTYEYSVDETLTVAGDGTRTVTALFALRRDLTLYKDNSTRLNSTDGTAGAGYFDKEIEDGSYMFHLSCSRPTDFYAVRVYDRVLTDAERAENRFADILNYYGVVLPDGYMNDEAQVAYTKEQLASIGFETDASRYAATKASVQAAIKSVYTNITVVIGEKETETTVLGDKWLSPEGIEGKILFGWKLLGENDTYTTYEAGASIPVKEGDVVRAFALTKPQTMSTSSVKMMDEDGLGMRFTATLSKGEYLELLDAYGSENVSLGLMITPRQYVERAGVFTKEGLKAWAEGLGSSETPYVDIPLAGVWKMEGDVLTLAGSLCNFSSVTIEKNISFAATAYINIDKDGDGTVDQTVYGDFYAGACRTAKEVMETVDYLYRDTLTDKESEWLDAFLAYYENRTYGNEGDKTVAEQRQEILVAMQIAKSQQVNYTVHPFAEGEVDAKYAHIQAISFDGLDYNGKKTRIFAYLGLPEGASAETPVPAVVLIHGGGGNAYMEWVRRWNARGYAAIAMETTGYFPVTPGANITEGAYSNAAHAFPDYILETLGENAENYTLAPDRFSATEYAEVDTMWHYHGISAVILAHNVLRQNEAVDNTRIGVHGVSWGGVLTAHVIGYDNRFAFAVPTYGSAYLGEEEKAFSSYGNAYVDDLWAPERNLSNATMPVMWFAWADDTWFIMNGYTKSYLHQLPNNQSSNLVVLKDWAHSHVQTYSKEHAYAFADAICFGATPFVTFESQPVGQNVSCKLNVPAGVTNVGVRIHYLTEPIAYDKAGCPSSLVEDFKTNTTALSFDSEPGMITGTIPADVKYYYISVLFTTVEGKSLEVSSTFVMVK
ncbi:MAG: prolyl oligopeptidase family serine peptidase [Clostridia bacterium]|nr:prolyl oligopeptidase family serine peptidase [Clostridia bacterium]